MTRWSAQRAAVKQRPHQETTSYPEAMSEPVVHHHGREGGGAGSDEVRPSAFNGLLGSLSSGSALQIAVSDRADVGDAQAHEGLRLTGSEDKLDFKSIGRMNIDNRAEIAATETMLGKISIQDDSVEQVKHDYPG
jgi:hypothetical protein